MPYDPNAYNTYDVASPLASLKNYFNRRQPGSRLDTIANAGPAGLDALSSLPQAADDFLRKGPGTPAQSPPSALNGGTSTQASGREQAMLNGQIVPLSASPYKNGPQTPSPMNEPVNRGGMSFSGGNPRLSSTPGALDNLSALSKQFDAPSLSAEELYKGAFADPASRAPGSTQYMQEMLGERTGANALAEEKLRQPAEIARINAAGGVAQQQEASRGAAGVAKINAGASQGKLEALQSMLSGGIQPGGSVSVSGVGSVRAPSAQAPNSALMNEVTRMKFAAEQSLGRKWSWDGPTPEEKALTQSVKSAVYGDRSVPDDVKDAVLSVLADKSLASMSNDDIAASAENDDGSPLNPQIQHQILNLLNLYR